MNDEKIPLIGYYRNQLRIATSKATPGKSIFNQTLKIIEKIRQARSINSLYNEFTRFEMYTRYSREICIYILQHEWLLSLLIHYIEVTNRSEPHKQLIANILGIFLNLLKLVNADLNFAREDLARVAMKNLRNFPKVKNISTKCHSLLAYF